LSYAPTRGYILTRPSFNVNAGSPFFRSKPAIRLKKFRLFRQGRAGAGFWLAALGGRFFGAGAAHLAGQGAEQQRQVVERLRVVLTLAAYVADPGREIRHGDELVGQPGEIGHAGFVHHADVALAAGNHALRFAILSQI